MEEKRDNEQKIKELDEINKVISEIFKNFTQNQKNK